MVIGLWISAGLASAEPSTHLRASAGPVGVSSQGWYATEVSLEVERLFLGNDDRHGFGIRGALAADWEFLGDTNGLAVAEPYWVSTFRTGRRTFVATQVGFGLGLRQEVDSSGLFSPSETTNHLGWTVHGAPGFGWRPGSLELAVFGRVRAHELAVTFTPVLAIGGHF